MTDIKEELWVTKEGTAIPISDMSEEHLRNTLKMIVKQLRRGDLTRLGYHHGRLNLARAIADIEEVELCQRSI